MGKITFITGGARSGKSSFAEKIAAAYPDVAYIATSIATDSEMEERIRLHRQRRPYNWRTYEAYKGIRKIIKDIDKGAILLDCVTVMVTNIMMECDIDWDHCTTEQSGYVEALVKDEIVDMLDAARGSSADFIIVSNEVGMGLVPAYPLGRIFRDIAGRINQFIASYADEAYFMVSGIPIELKPGNGFAQ